MVRTVTIILLIFFSVNFVAAKELKLAGGELEIDKWGMHTFVHRYGYPEERNILLRVLHALNPSYPWLDERPAVLIIGVMSVGEPGYYLLLNRFIRKSCDVIIYDRPQPVPEEGATEELDMMLRAIDMTPPTLFLLESLGEFRKANKALDPYEGIWFRTDNIWRLDQQRQRFWEEVIDRIEQISPKEKNELISQTRILLTKTESVRAAKQNYLRWVKLIDQTHGAALQPIRDFMFREHGELALTIFDNLRSFRPRKSENFCFAVNPYHLALVKRLLEKRGFEFQYVKQFMMMSFR